MINRVSDLMDSIRLDSVAVNLGIVGLNFSLGSGSGHHRLSSTVLP